MDIEVHGLTLALVALLAVILATGILPEQVGGGSYSTLEFALMGSVGALLLFASVLLHELAHAFATRAFGRPVSRVIVFLHGTPGPEDEETRSPWREFATAGAGPLVTVLLAGLAGLVAHFGADLRFIGPIASFLGLANLLFGLSFLLPALPLDGGRMLRAVLWGLCGTRLAGTRWACTLGRAFSVLLLLTCVAQMLRGGVAAGWMWGAFLSVALWFQSGLAWRATKVHERLRGLVAADVVEPAPHALSRVTSVADALLALVHAGSPALARTFLVEYNGRLGGLVSLATLRSVPDEERGATPVGQVADRLRFEHLISPAMPLEAVLRRMATQRLALLPVVKGGTVVGVVRRDAIALAIEGQLPRMA